MPRLAAYVHVAGKVYGPGDEPPAAHAALITNPDAWEDGVLPDPVDGAPDTQPPPRHGKGSSLADWTAYAEANDVQVPDDANRDAVIAACATAGVPVDRQSGASLIGGRVVE